MMRGLWTSASGMTAQQTNLDVIANNLANVNTTGFKGSRADFQDLLYQTMRAAGTASSETAKIPTGIDVGLGVRTASVQKVFTPGHLKQTGNPYDVAIEGDGFFVVQGPNGTAYTRDGALKLNDQGQLVTSDGYVLQPGIAIDPEAENISIAPDGTVSVRMPGQVDPEVKGRISVARFVNPAGLSNVGGNLYVATAASGAATEGTAGVGGFGRIAQNTLELSNVSVVEEMVSMIIAQRAYETNSKSIQAADEMLQMANQLRR